MENAAEEEEEEGGEVDEGMGWWHGLSFEVRREMLGGRRGRVLGQTSILSRWNGTVKGK